MKYLGNIYMSTRETKITKEVIIMAGRYYHKTFATPEELRKKLNTVDPELPDIETVLYIHRACENADEHEENVDLRKQYYDIDYELYQMVENYVTDQSNAIKVKFTSYDYKDVDAFDEWAQFVKQLPTNDFGIFEDKEAIVEALRIYINLETDSKPPRVNYFENDYEEDEDGWKVDDEEDKYYE